MCTSLSYETAVLLIVCQRFVIIVIVEKFKQSWSWRILLRISIGGLIKMHVVVSMLRRSAARTFVDPTLIRHAVMRKLPT